MPLPLTGSRLAKYNNLGAGIPPEEPLGDLLNQLYGPTAYKTADETVVSSTVLQADDELFFDVEPGIWIVDATLFFNVPADGLKVALDGTLGVASMRVEGFIYDNQLRSVSRLTTLGAAISHAAAGPGDHDVILNGTIEVSTAGRLGIYWAQQTSNPAGLVLQRGSYFRCRSLG